MHIKDIILNLAIVMTMFIASGNNAVFAEKNEKTERIERPLSGTLVFPAAVDEKKTEKECMTVCARWGEDCMLVNHGAGGMSRKCRRSCKQFTEECF